MIADEVQGVGTVDHAPVYPREIMRRALELSASAIILVHNHPSGDPQPSTDDIHLTHQIIAVGKPLKVAVHRQAGPCKLEGIADYLGHYSRRP